LHDEVRGWFAELSLSDPPSADPVAAAIDVRAREGPTLGRPLVDRLKGSNFHNMKELRPGSAKGSEIRLVFAFDPARTAIFLVAGDKARQWNRWHREAIKLADLARDAHD